MASLAETTARVSLAGSMDANETLIAYDLRGLRLASCPEAGGGTRRPTCRLLENRFPEA